jgi:hypothetical protein
MTALTGAAVWLQPVLLTAVVLRVAAGDPEAPWLALGALIAPLVALLAPGRRPPGPNRVTAAAAAVAVALLLAADFVVAADTAALLGGPPWLGVALAAAVALLVPLTPGARQASAPLLAIAAVGLLLPLAVVAQRTGTGPWGAWSQAGLRPALTFSDTSGWVRDGQRFARAARLRFSEGQRVTALSAGLFRVVERDATPPTVRDWRLAAGEALTLRPGDELSVEAGARLRFEAGRRVPGAPASGITWADAPARGPRMLPGALGVLITLLGGALALVPAARRGPPAAAAPLALMVAVVGAMGWGVYAALTAPDLALGRSLPAPLLQLPTRALGPATGGALALLAGGAIALLLLTAVVALRVRLAAAAGAPAASWGLVVGLAAALAVWSPDPWRLFVLGLGLAAAVWTPALLATGQTAAVAGSLVGGLVFIALAGLPLLAPPPAAGSRRWPDTLRWPRCRSAGQRPGRWPHPPRSATPSARPEVR